MITLIILRRYSDYSEEPSVVLCCHSYPRVQQFTLNFNSRLQMKSLCIRKFSNMTCLIIITIPYIFSHYSPWCHRSTTSASPGLGHVQGLGLWGRLGHGGLSRENNCYNNISIIFKIINKTFR